MQKKSLETIVQEIKLHEQKLDILITEILKEYPNVKVYTRGHEQKGCSLHYKLGNSNTDHIKVDIHQVLS